MKQSNRLPFNRRVRNPPNLELTDRDVAVVKAVYEHRMLSRDQIQRLFFPSVRTANRRLALLYQHQYLDRLFVPPTFRQNERSTQAAYVLDRRAEEVLTVISGVPFEKVSTLRKKGRVGTLFFEHLLMVNDFRIAVTQAAKARGDEILGWQSEWELAAHDIRVMDFSSGRTLPVRPDGYFIYRFQEGNDALLFVEIDRSTMTTKRFCDKVLGYIAYRQTGEFEKHFGAGSFRVLTVTLTRARLEHLIRATEKVGGKRMFWFTTINHIDQIFGPVWNVASQSEQVPLAA